MSGARAYRTDPPVCLDTGMTKIRRYFAALASVLLIGGGVSLVQAAPAAAGASGCYSRVSGNGIIGECYYGPGSFQLHLVCKRAGYADKTGSVTYYVPAGGVHNKSYYCPSTAWLRADAWMTYG